MQKASPVPWSCPIVPGKSTEVLVGGVVSGEGCGQETVWVENERMVWRRG